MKLLLLVCAKPVIGLLGGLSFLALKSTSPIGLEAMPMEPPRVEEAIPVPAPEPVPVRPDEDGE